MLTLGTSLQLYGSYMYVGAGQYNADTLCMPLQGLADCINLIVSVHGSIN